MLVMAHKDYCTGLAQFICDTVSELDDLPKVNQPGKQNLHTVFSCSPGSIVLVTSTSEKYILVGNTNTWTLYSSGTDTGTCTGTGGSGGDNPGDSEWGAIDTSGNDSNLNWNPIE